ncbi:hypothetical protein [Nocardia transvalensis]|uniref:hypothetical protein n=1 Tax=Nocardia transvalensis TaxID=37333 RepID=UPI001894EF70|nr:hypothetical protein [Nocardia transvalensis]MBF6331860.1 hypothetical protein [Nocardia transvalensis]
MSEPLPNMSRLVAVWDGEEKSATSLEHATQVMLTMWMTSLADLDILRPGAWSEPSRMNEAKDLARTIARVIDDEVTWHLGNRNDTVVLVDDDLPEIVTVGEMVGHLAMLAVLVHKWPHDRDDCPLAPAFRQTGHRYNRLTAALVAGTRRQPRRRSHGAAPVPRPRRIDLGVLPRHTDGSVPWRLS